MLLLILVISAVNLSLKLYDPDSILGFYAMKTLLNSSWDIKDFQQM
jgi:hypothetical protein